jgi:hypothetical protein
MDVQEEPQEVVTIQQWSTQKAQLFWFLDPTEFIIAVAVVLFFPFLGWQLGMNLIAATLPGMAYMTLLIVTKMGRRRGNLNQMIRYFLRSKIWYPAAYEDNEVHLEINPDLEFTSIRHLYDPGFQLKQQAPEFPHRNSK